MTDTSTVGARRSAGNWRHRETRASKKYVAKRVTEAEHKLINDYADSQDVSVADLLSPAVADILARARAHQGAVAREVSHDVA